MLYTIVIGVKQLYLFFLLYYILLFILIL
ncbi:Hypothetical protein EIN_178570, partial [Entamoeba invadens IP1]